MKFNFKKNKNIYMIGIKGVGMTMLAQFLVKRGCYVSGSDNPEVYLTDKVLRAAKIKVYNHFAVKNIPAKVDLVIYSSAYNAANNIEVTSVLNDDYDVMTYAEALGAVFNTYYGIAVCGSHGKTTTSAWLGYVLWKAGVDPSVLVGSRVPQLNGSAILGQSKYFVAETDEYQNKLQYFMPHGVLLNNIDYDHPDFFKTEKDYLEVFKKFIKKIPTAGFLVANFDDENIKKIIKSCEAKVLKYSLSEKSKADFIAYDIKSTDFGQVFKVKNGTRDLGEFKIKLLGDHSIYNALAVIIAAKKLKIKDSDIKKNLFSFTGTERRMQLLGEFNGAKIIDDYAHHPTEIKATLAGIRKFYPQRNLITVFHPHTFTRTKALLKDFAVSFDATDELIILDIYGSAREEQGGVSSLDLIKEVKAYNQKNNNKTQKVTHLSDINAVVEYLKGSLKSNDLLVLMGAGDVFRVADELLKK